MPRNRARRPITGVNFPYDLGVAAFPQHPDARVMWVDPSNGNDGASGEDYRHPVATLQEAIDRCTDDQGDIINVLPGSHSVSSMVSFNKRGITVQAVSFGMNPSAQGERFTVNAASSLDTGPVATIYDPCRIRGLGFAGRDTTAESLLLDCEATGGFNAGFVHLINCRFSAWYGAMTYFVRSLGGQLTRIEDCTFDGLFGGVGTAAIGLESDTGPIDPGFVQVLRNYFYEMGSGKHAIAHVSGSTQLGVHYHENYLLPGFGGNQGKFLDNNSCDATGLISENHVAPLANQAAAFENLTNASFGFSNNHYDE